MKKLLIGSLLFTSLVPHGFSQEKTMQHSSHEHGAANLNIVQENKLLTIQLESPAMNLVGFEHLPSTQAHFEIIEDVQSKLNNANALFTFNKKAKCTFIESEIESELFHSDEHHEEDEHHEDEDDHHEEGEHHEDEDDHHEEGEYHEDDHHEDGEHHEDEDDHHEEGEHHEAENETHNDIDVVWQFKCKSPKRLKELEVNLIQFFPSFDDIDAQFILQKSQGVQELNAEDNVIKF